MAADRLLLDVGPATGGHGARGIGRYVRGLVEAMVTEWPADRLERIWAVGLKGDTLRSFGSRGIASRFLGLRPGDLGPILGARLLALATGRVRAGVFHATDPQRPWRTRRIRQVVTVYDLIPLHESEMLASWRFNHRLAYRSYLEQVRSAERVIAISATSAADVSGSLGIAPERVSVVTPLVHAPPEIRRDPASTPEFIWVGALDVHKQPELAVEALAVFRRRSHEGTLRFIGPSGDAQRARLMNRAAELGVGEFVRIDGLIPDAALEAALASATALISTSRIEGFGLPGVEAVLRGVPVIAVDIPAARETVGGAADLVPGEAEAIATAMATPRLPPAEAVKRIRSSYSREATAARLWDVYSEVLEGA